LTVLDKETEREVAMKFLIKKLIHRDFLVSNDGLSIPTEVEIRFMLRGVPMVIQLLRSTTELFGNAWDFKSQSRDLAAFVNTRNID
jgi:hypothetical protein